MLVYWVRNRCRRLFLRLNTRLLLSCLRDEDVWDEAGGGLTWEGGATSGTVSAESALFTESAVLISISFSPISSPSDVCFFGFTTDEWLTGAWDGATDSSLSGSTSLYTAWNPFQLTVSSEWNLSSSSLPDDTNGDGLVVPQNFPSLSESSSLPSYTSM